MKSTLRRVAAGVFGGVGVFAMTRRRQAGERAVVLRYHSVSEMSSANERYRCPSIAVAPHTFRRQMEFLASRYRVVPVQQIVETLQAGEPFPERCAAITFDDGYRDNHRHALPVLRSLGLPATVFVVSDAIGDGRRFWVARIRSVLLGAKRDRIVSSVLGEIDLRTLAARRAAVDTCTAALCRLSVEARDAELEALAGAAGLNSVAAGHAVEGDIMLDWDELRELSAAGVEIGAHTRTHPILTAVSDDVARGEIRASKQALEQGLQREVRQFAYPNGPGVPRNHDASTMTMVEEAGLESAWTSRNGCLGRGDDRYSLKRIPISNWPGRASFAFALERDQLPGLGYGERS